MQNSSKFQQNNYRDTGLERVVNRIYQVIERDELVIDTTEKLRDFLQVDRVVLYYFYDKWHGQVTFESLDDDKYSILGSTGPDKCFNDEYAALYIAGRTRAIADIEKESIEECHRDFLRSLQVRANLAVPILLPEQNLWGLLIAHHCQAPRIWLQTDIEVMQEGAKSLGNCPSIKDVSK
ncbi:MAG: GAF domain-containing protein [Cyanobacteria bacterium P01_A01_bin.84]